jgi:hypothetical protein
VLAPTFVSTGVGGKPTVEFSSVNVQIVSGAPKENEANGEGNLVLGLNESPGTQTGSNNLVLGKGQTYTSWGSLLGGVNNNATGPYSDVFGRYDSATGLAASVGGGINNSAEGLEASVSGGSLNKAHGGSSSVGGGRNNRAEGEGSSVSGGENNQATGKFTAVFGGKGEAATSGYEAVPAPRSFTTLVAANTSAQQSLANGVVAAFACGGSGEPLMQLEPERFSGTQATKGATTPSVSDGGVFSTNDDISGIAGSEAAGLARVDLHAEPGSPCRFWGMSVPSTK